MGRRWWRVAVASVYRRPGHRQGVFVANRRASGVEQRKKKCAPFALRCKRLVFCWRSCTLSSYMCFTTVYCTRSRGPVRNRTEPEVPLTCGGPVRFELAGPFDCEGTRWIRTCGSRSWGRSPFDPLEPFALLLQAQSGFDGERWM